MQPACHCTSSLERDPRNARAVRRPKDFGAYTAKGRRLATRGPASERPSLPPRGPTGGLDVLFPRGPSPAASRTEVRGAGSSGDDMRLTSMRTPRRRCPGRESNPLETDLQSVTLAALSP